MKVSEAIRRLEESARSFDEGWMKIHLETIDAFREALGMPDATMPDMVKRIIEMRIALRMAGRN